jgi:hypothetical protein
MSAQVSFFFFDVYYAASRSSLFKTTGLCALGCVVMVIFFSDPDSSENHLEPACAHLYIA